MMRLVIAALSLRLSLTASDISTHNVSHLGWYAYDVNARGMPTATHASLLMNGNLSFLLDCHRRSGVPGLLNLEKAKGAASGSPGCLWKKPATDAASESGSFMLNGTLAPGWRAAVDDCVLTLTPLAQAKKLVGVMIGDELVCGGLPLSNLTALSQQLHDALSSVGLFVYTNECFREGNLCKNDTDCAPYGSGAGPASCHSGACKAAVWSHIPSGLDHISLDVYPGNGRTEPAVSQSYAERYFLPMLLPHQSIWVVPGLFGRNATEDNTTAMAATDATLLAKVTGYWEWAAREPRLTGFLPWHCKSKRSTF